MDINDEEVSIRELGLSEGLVKFYETVYPNFNLYMKYDFVGTFYKGYATVELNGKWYKIDTKGNIEAIVNEHTVVITKSDLRKIVLECVEKIRGII